jgi:hypothetical protein
MLTAMSDPRGGDAPASRGQLVSFGQGVLIAEGEFVPAAITIEVGRLLRMSVPLGAFTVREGKARFVATVDVVGLTAVVLGIGVGGLAVRTAGPIIRAVAERLRSS